VAARADRGHGDRVGIAEGEGDQGADREGDDHARKERDDPTEARLADFGEVDAEGGGDDGEIPEHRAAHQADPGEERHVGEALAAVRHHAADIGENEAEQDGECRAVNAVPAANRKDSHISEPAGEGGKQAGS
jgi:hypothetical protein